MILLLAIAQSIAGAAPAADTRAKKNIRAIAAGTLKSEDLTIDEQQEVSALMRELKMTNMKNKPPACRAAYQLAESAASTLSTNSKRLVNCADMGALASDCSMEAGWVRIAHLNYTNAVFSMNMECKP
jgi:hypothetical protein